MNRNLVITSATFLCLLALFGMNNAAYATYLTPSDTATGTTPEGVILTETFDGPSILEIGTDHIWTLIITVTAPDTDPDTDYHNVVVTEKLSAELEVNGPDPPAPGVTVNTMGSSPDNAKLITWTIEVIPDDTTATLELEISTDKNGHGFQSYTSCGCYELNSGITIDYDEQGTNGKYSEFGWVWRVCIPCDSVPLFSDILWVLPIATITGAVIVHRKRDHRT